MSTAWAGPDPALALLRQALEQALLAEANDLLAAAKPRTPHETGDLENSGEVLPPEWSGTTCTVVVGFGRGPDPLPLYAVIQHERLDFHHDPGRIAKWLEVTGLERMPGMPDRIAARVTAIIGGGNA